MELKLIHNGRNTIWNMHSFQKKWFFADEADDEIYNDDE